MGRARNRFAASLACSMVMLSMLCSCVGPRSSEGQGCALCGKDRTRKTWLGVTYMDWEADTELSRWYAAKGLKPHEHRWQGGSISIRRWNGSGLCGDSFGFFLLPLRHLQEVEPYADQATFRRLCRQYYACVRDPKRANAFTAKCNRIVLFNPEYKESAETVAWLARFERKLLKSKEEGYIPWGAKPWMKPPEYYRKLDTMKLAEEFFGTSSAFASEFSRFARLGEGPRLRFIHLRVFHNAWAELVKRDDLWRGILHAYDYMSLRLKPHDLDTNVMMAGNLGSMALLYALTPLKEQVKGREALFIAAHIRALKRFRDVIEKTDPKAESCGFFGEPGWMAEVGLALRKRIDPEGYARVAPLLGQIHWSKEQRREELKANLDLYIVVLEK